MSELKAYNVVATADVNPDVVDNLGCTEWPAYDKEEADKVIAEKDAEIAQLQAMLEERNKQVGELNHRIAPKQSDKTLQERLNEVCKKHGVSTLQDLDWAFCESEKRRTKDNIDAANIIYHQKFKRCLAMARWCKDKVDAIKNGYMVSSIESQHGVMTTCPPECNPKFSYYSRWQKRWLKIAEKFKEAKEY